MNSMPTETILVMMTAFSGLVLLYPFQRRPKAVEDSDQVEHAVYRNQLKELESDRLMGLFSEEQAEYVRAEIARRLFTAKENTRTRSHRAASHSLTLASMVVLVGAAFLFYLSIGRPDLPSHPFVRQASAEGLRPTPLTANADATVAVGSPMTPGTDAASLDSMAETLMAISDGIVTEDARKLLERSLALEPRNPRARFYIALSMEQAGKTKEARAAFEALAVDSPAGAPWLPLVNEHITKNGGDAIALTDQSTALAGPTAKDVAAAETMNSDDRQQMIRGMVESLNTKLAKNPGDFEGWTRLMRSYAVLNDMDRAESAMKQGLAVFPASGEQGKQILGLAKELGISTEGLSE